MDVLKLIIRLSSNLLGSMDTAHRGARCIHIYKGKGWVKTGIRFSLARDDRLISP